MDNDETYLNNSSDYIASRDERCGLFEGKKLRAPNNRTTSSRVSLRQGQRRWKKLHLPSQRALIPRVHAMLSRCSSLLRNFSQELRSVSETMESPQPLLAYVEEEIIPQNCDLISILPSTVHQLWKKNRHFYTSTWEYFKRNRYEFREGARYKRCERAEMNNTMRITENGA